MAAIWGGGVPTTLLDGGLADTLRAVGATRVQVNVSDDAVAGAMRISELDPPVDAVVSLWSPEPEAALDVLADRLPRVAVWSVTERAPLDPALPADRARIDALSNIAFLRRPADLDRDAWLHIWLDEHTQVAIDTQATFGYYQNVVDEPLTPGAPHVDAIVEELFPMAAVSDVHAFYGSGGDRAELERRMRAMLASVARFGADRNLDVVPTSRYDFRL
ncbi:hypothetical protein ACWDTI_24530 [Gordonia sp. NPDC003424]